jgi:hypothetical protein
VLYELTRGLVKLVVTRQATSKLLDSDRRVWGLNWQTVSPITINEILGNPNRFFTETSISIREELRIELEIVDRNILDVDFNWPNPHYYLGNWQYGRQDNIYSGTSDTEGFLTDELTIIHRYTPVTIAADFGRLATIDANLRIQQCNFELRPKLKVFLPLPTPEVTYQPNNSDPLFEGLLQRQPPNLRTSAYGAEIYSAVISLRPGVELVTAYYTALPTNTISINEPAYQLPTCKLPDNKECTEEFNDFISNQNAGRDPTTDPNLFYTDRGNCELAYGGCVEQTFTCADGGVRSYWILNPI